MRASHLEVLVEEESMARTVRHLLPRIIGDDVSSRVITSDERAGFRDPDSVKRTWETLEKVLQKAEYHEGGLRKISLADDVAPHLDLDDQRSHSFRAFVSGVRFLVEGAA